MLRWQIMIRCTFIIFCDIFCLESLGKSNFIPIFYYLCARNLGNNSSSPFWVYVDQEWREEWDKIYLNLKCIRLKINTQQQHQIFMFTLELAEVTKYLLFVERHKMLYLIFMVSQSMESACSFYNISKKMYIHSF